MSDKKLAIIGLGPRGLNILERIITLHQKYLENENIEIILIEPNHIGTGVHDIEQPEHLLVNTVACQITMFGDHTITPAEPMILGPSFYDWVQEQGYRHVDGRYLKVKDKGTPIAPNDYLPRALLGKYLSWTYHYLVTHCNKNIKITHSKSKVTNLTLKKDKKIKIDLESGSELVADFVFLTTGHGKNLPSMKDYQIKQFVNSARSKNPKLNYIDKPYPITKLTGISSEARVLIQGIGLTAYDVISHLTQGRNGQFYQENGNHMYKPSGNEPSIFIHSREVLPFSGRALNQKGVGGQYQPSFFTDQAIKRIKTDNLKNGQIKIDFEKQLFPLLFKEMCYVYRSTLEGHWLHVDSYEISAEDEKYIKYLFSPNKGKTFSSLSGYTSWFLNYLNEDIKEAEKGNVKGAVKAATDVIRDIRDILRDAIDFGGLLPESHKHFIEHYCPIMNRIAVGPPKERNQQLMSLMESGVIKLAGGPSSQIILNEQEGCFEIHTQFEKEVSIIKADVLIKARLDGFSPCSDDSALIYNLNNQGMIRPFINGNYHCGGIDIDNKMHPITQNGTSIDNIWALGNIAEGPNFYTYVLPRPFVNSRAIRDAGNIVIEMYGKIKESIAHEYEEYASA
ncbi:FAD/NAD(P)-binding protein [Xenorhabdus sp. ZM]|uniref:FAD/NAD(P)-binding protein n=1 Tax=Xenorhabdus szentirmaii TaxID=290112 RepID=UPI0019843698|nr:FAD/NAD(P)-binding protein [Xenorhabdus sp. ZM]MBD2803228.1 FAD/NAD(P)-binding protein [Xenorhabdus sp. ZM]